jgi:hypothetical protein
MSDDGSTRARAISQIPADDLRRALTLSNQPSNFRVGPLNLLAFDFVRVCLVGRTPSLLNGLVLTGAIRRRV